MKLKNGPVSRRTGYHWVKNTTSSGRHDYKGTMAPRKKESALPTRRSARTVSQSSTVTATDVPSESKKRETEDPAIGDQASEAKKAKKGLGIGDKLPDITLHDEDGNSIKIGDITSEKGIILFA